ncbi:MULTISPECIES: hypothetical protein [unclassified Polaribacter]|nr:MULTISPECIES: hypothetical protein [unclassified Polaribacter]KGL59557.1 hypothetical protein PHEL49_0416 [Polaribacter sp. Hel1_33_49]
MIVSPPTSYQILIEYKLHTSILDPVNALLGTIIILLSDDA